MSSLRHLATSSLAFTLALTLGSPAVLAQSPPTSAEEIELAQGSEPLAQQQRPRPKSQRPRPRRPATNAPRRPQRPRGQRPRRSRRAGAGACPRQIDTPVQVGAGPSAHFINGPLRGEQLAHFGGRLSLTGVMLEETMRKHWRCFPDKYRRLLRKPQEVRAKPLAAALIPSELIISPKLHTTAIYGVGWNLLGVGASLLSSDAVKFSLKANLPLKYMYIQSDTVASPTHFLRPGLGGKAELEFKLAPSFLISLGWESQLFVPQRVGGTILEVGPLNEAIWHIGQAFLQFHIRLPYKTNAPW